MTIQIIPTVVPKALADIVAARKRYAALTPALHIDICDGIFAPNTTWSVLPGEKLPEPQIAQYEVHLMVANPLQAGMTFARAGAKRIIAHIEAFDNADCAREAFDMWQKAGATESGLAILYTTPLEELIMYEPLCDFVHVMTIEKIGKQGAPIAERALERVREVHAQFPRLTISVDGGISAQAINDFAEAGASRFSIGSALAKAKDPAKEFAKLAAA